MGNLISVQAVAARVLLRANCMRWFRKGEYDFGADLSESDAPAHMKGI
jgi:hypothetical protein